MRRRHRTLAAGTVLLALVAAACGRDDDAGTAMSAGSVNIEFRSDPDPPQSGDNTYQVTVKQPDGTPVTDADVTAVFSMPAMPSMNMPAMRSDAPLAHIGDGTYRGTGQLSMAGTWNVVVSISQGTEPPGTARFSIVAK